MEIGQLCKELAVYADYSDADRFVADAVTRNPKDYPSLYAAEMRRRAWKVAHPTQKKAQEWRPRRYAWLPRWYLREFKAYVRQASCCGVMYMMPQKWMRKPPRCSLCGKSLHAR